MKSIETKRREAADRKAQYEALTLDQKLALIRSRPGNNKRELARLMNQKESKQ